MLKIKKSTGHKEINGYCPMAAASKIIGDIWTLLIIRDLLKGAKRFNELLESLKGISSSTLVQRLKLLESENILTRVSFPEIPPRVEYSLTQKGTDLHLIVEAIKSYGEKYESKSL
jgi:DNA-binding HxlR family transcriptional regulator